LIWNMATISREAPVLIAGPTASGKSALALELAARDGRVIVNADALQVYDCWRLLTARPTVAEEAALPHALYGHLGREAEWSVGHWLRAVAGLLARPVVIVGGPGLYFSALTEGLAAIPPTPPPVRAEADALLAGGGVAALLGGVDGQTRARIDMANPARVQRAWEVQRATGRGLAAWQDDTGPPLLPLGRTEALVLRPQVDWLNTRIDGRFDAMMASGALDEVAAELPHWTAARPSERRSERPPASPSERVSERPSERPSARAIGAAELVAHLRGERSLDAAVAGAKLASRQYAKRQRTWFRSRMGLWREIALP